MKKKKLQALEVKNVKSLNKLIKMLPLFMESMINGEIFGRVKPNVSKDEWDERCAFLLNEVHVVNGGGENAGQYLLPSLLGYDRSPQSLNFARFRGEDGSVDFQNTSTDGTNIITILGILMNEVRIAMRTEPNPDRKEYWNHLLIGLQHSFDSVASL